MRPSYDNLLQIIEEQRKTIDALEKKVARLEERLGLNSQNSSKPPSTDQKKNKKPSKGGAKPGHPGSSRKLFPEEQVTKKVISDLIPFIENIFVNSCRLARDFWQILPCPFLST